MDSEKKYQKEKRFALVIGSLYALAGAVQFLLGIGLPGFLSRFLSETGLSGGPGFSDSLVSFAGALFIRPDILGGLVLLVIGVTFLSGAKELRAGISEGEAYVYVGTLLSFVFALVYLLTMSGNALEAFVLGNEDFENWTFLTDMKPGIYLAVLSILAYISRGTRFSLSEATEE